jgi:hypothetical protein
VRLTLSQTKPASRGFFVFNERVIAFFPACPCNVGQSLTPLPSRVRLFLCLKESKCLPALNRQSICAPDQIGREPIQNN